MTDQWPYDTITKRYEKPKNMNSSNTACVVFAILATILIKFQFLTVAARMNCDDFWQSAEHVLMDGRPLLAMASVTASSSRLLPPGNLQQIHFERFDPFLRFLVQQNTALFSTFLRSSVRSSVTGVTYQLFSIFWRFIPWKPYIFWMHII